MPPSTSLPSPLPQAWLFKERRKAEADGVSDPWRGVWGECSAWRAQKRLPHEVAQQRWLLGPGGQSLPCWRLGPRLLDRDVVRAPDRFKESLRAMEAFLILNCAKLTGRPPAQDTGQPARCGETLYNGILEWRETPVLRDKLENPPLTAGLPQSLSLLPSCFHALASRGQPPRDEQRGHN